MGSIRLVGKLTDPLDGTPDAGAELRFTQMLNIGDTLRTSTSILTIDETGDYDITLAYGKVMIEYITDPYLNTWENLGTALIDENTQATTIAHLLGDFIPPSDNQLKDLSFYNEGTISELAIALENIDIALGLTSDPAITVPLEQAKTSILQAQSNSNDSEVILMNLRQSLYTN